MKKRNLKWVAVAMALCISPAFPVCAANASQTEAFVVRDTEISAEKYTEIAAQYAIYAPYGMIYDAEGDRFYYHGQMVRYFKDAVSREHTNGFFFADGVVDVVPIKDANGTLIGLQQSSASAFQARTEKQNAIEAAVSAAGIAGSDESVELGETNQRDDTLDAYISFGVSYDPLMQKWLYDGKLIRIFYDADHNTYYDGNAKDGVNLRVVRDKNGSIEQLMEIEKGVLEQYVTY